jgi:predicted Zn-dependent protease
MTMKHRLGRSLPCLAAALLLSCATTGPGGKKSLVLVSSEQETSIGREMDQQVRASERFLADSLWQSYITEIGQRIVAVSDRRELPFQFAVIESDQINAFAAPGGFVYFYTGLLREMDTEAEMTAVMAHEISHVVGRHGVKRLQSVMGISIVLDLALGNKSTNTKALAGTAIGVILAGYSRSQEKEADEFGLTYMTRAGWDPNGAVSMFEKLAALSGDRKAGFFEQLASSHPDTQSRIAAAKQAVVAMKPFPPGLVLDSKKFQDMKKRLPAQKPAVPEKG